MLEDLCSDFKVVNLRAVLQQTRAYKLRNLLKIQTVDPVGQLFVDNPKVFRKHSVSITTITKPTKDVFKVCQKTGSEQAYCLVTSKNLKSDAIQRERSEFDLFNAQELGHQSLLSAKEFFVINNKKTLGKYLAVKSKNVFIITNAIKFFLAN